MTTIERTGPQGTPLPLTRQRQVRRGRFLFDNMDWHEHFTYDAQTGSLIWRRRSLESFQTPTTAVMDCWNTRFERKVAGCLSKGYILVRVGGHLRRAHRIIWEMHYGPIPKGMEVDHKNTIRYDNRIQNLRLATPEQNRSNTGKRSHNKQLYKGVSHDKDRKNGAYSASITLSGKAKYLGRYNTPEEAHQAYCKAAKKHRGEFARFK